MGIPVATKCLIPWFDDAIFSLEWKEAASDKFVMGGATTTHAVRARCAST